MNNEKPQEKNEKQLTNEIKEENGRFQYYVNYLEHPRRVDRWVEENMVLIDDEAVENLFEKFKNQ